VNWSTRVCAPAAGLLECYYDFRFPFSSTVGVRGSIKLDKDGQQRFFLQVTSIEATSDGAGLLGIAVAPYIKAAIQGQLVIRPSAQTRPTWCTINFNGLALTRGWPVVHSGRGRQPGCPFGAR
jgi:hypothetical protein